MSRETRRRRGPRDERDGHNEHVGQRGQALVLFALLIVVILGGAGLLVDGGMAWANRRQAQAAADLAAIAAAKAIAESGFQCNATGLASAQAAATSVAGFNGFSNVTVEYPAATGNHTGCSYVRVTVSRTMATTFSRVMGQDTWTPQASAVGAVIQTQGAAAANCTFCSLNSSNRNHTLLVQLGSTLIVDGDIYVNSSNGNKNGDPNSAIKLDDWYVGGDGFDIFGEGGQIIAQHISVVGGWETHDGGIASAAEASCPAEQRPDPLAYATLNPPLASNVCIHQPPLVDPLANFPVPNYSDYPVRSTHKASYAGGTTYTIEPGIYIKGISISGNAIVNMNPGVYYMAGGKFEVKANATVIGNGVMIFSGSESGKTGKAEEIDIDTTGLVILTPATSGAFTGMTLFMERGSDESITIDPNNVAQCATTAVAGLPQGCIGGISGTIYAPHDDSLVTIKASGTANLQIIAGKLLVNNGSTARFTFNSGGFASTSTVISLVE